MGETHFNNFMLFMRGGGNWQMNILNMYLYLLLMAQRASYSNRDVLNSPAQAVSTQAFTANREIVVEPSLGGGLPLQRLLCGQSPRFPSPNIHCPPSYEKSERGLG